MVRLHKLGETLGVLNYTKKELLEDVSRRQGKRGGAILPSNLINLGKPTGITEEEFENALKTIAPNTTPFSSISTF